MKVYNNISELIGNTPLLRLNVIEKELGLESQIYAKVESFNVITVELGKNEVFETPVMTNNVMYQCA